MKVTDLLNSKKNQVTFSFEFIPPHVGVTKEKLLESIAPLMEMNPLFVDVTTHRNDVVLDVRGACINGYQITRHPSTLHVCECIRNRFPNTEVIPHVICGGFTREETQDLLIDMKFLGYDNLVALRGDKLSFQKEFVPEEQGNEHAVELIEQVRRLNNGEFLGGSFAPGFDFCIGAACYPEKHVETPDMELELYRTASKLSHGADFLISQMCFDVQPFHVFTTRLGSTAPVIPGIKVLTNPKQIEKIPGLFNVSIPSSLLHRMMDHPDDVKSIGVDFTVMQCKSLIKLGYKHLHFFTMNSTQTLKVLEKLL